MSSDVNKNVCYEIPICFSCLKVVNLKYVVSSKERNNYRYVICNCGQIIKVTKENKEEKISRLKRNGMDVKEAYELFFENGEKKDENVNKKYTYKSIKEIINCKREHLRIKKKEKNKSRLKIIK